MELTPPCPLDADIVATYGERLEPLIRRIVLHHGAPALQLNRFQEGGNRSATSSWNADAARALATRFA